MITPITTATATATAGLLGITMLTATPAMAATPCFDHTHPSACRARRDAHRMRMENRALRQNIRAQNRYIRAQNRNIRAQNRNIRRNMWTNYVAPAPVYTPYRVAPAPGLTIRF